MRGVRELSLLSSTIHHINREDVPAQIRNDLEAELGAVKNYNEGIAICVEAADNATKDLLEEILLDEDEHVDQLETWGG